MGDVSTLRMDIKPAMVIGCLVSLVAERSGHRVSNPLSLTQKDMGGFSYRHRNRPTSQQEPQKPRLARSTKLKSCSGRPSLLENMFHFHWPMTSAREIIKEALEMVDNSARRELSVMSMGHCGGASWS